jgi:actin-like ATPase involved in cell morphogenesis
MFKETPPELSADIYDKGMVVAGGGACLKILQLTFNQLESMFYCRRSFELCC